jgi:L-rhamnose mutarotase
MSDFKFDANKHVQVSREVLPRYYLAGRNACARRFVQLLDEQVAEMEKTSLSPISIHLEDDRVVIFGYRELTEEDREEHKRRAKARKEEMYNQYLHLCRWMGLKPEPKPNDDE